MNACIRRAGDDSIAFKCPGCGDTHVIPIRGSKAWGWNESLTRPTIMPSIDVKTGHYAPHWKEGDECWCNKDYGFTCYHCHSVITDGRIAFGPDCTHALAGQTVDLLAIGA